jgi:hypothetical protein
MAASLPAGGRRDKEGVSSLIPAARLTATAGGDTVVEDQPVPEGPAMADVLFLLKPGFADPQAGPGEFY